MKQLVFVHCVSPERVEQLRVQALGVVTLFGRWDILPAEACREDPLSLNIEIPDFRGESDLALLRNIPGVTRVGVFEADIKLPDPIAARKQYFAAA